MRAMVLDEFGGPEVLYAASIDRPTAAPDGVVVHVAYAGVNPADWKNREGWLAQFFEYRFPFVLGFDAAGVIAEVGEAVSDLAVGDRVLTASNMGRGERGTYAEYVASDRERVVKLPDSVGFAEAAAIPTAGCTCWEALFDVGGVTEGLIGTDQRRRRRHGQLRDPTCRDGRSEGRCDVRTVKSGLCPRPGCRPGHRLPARRHPKAGARVGT